MAQTALERAKTWAVILAIEGVIALAVVAGAQQLHSGVRTAQLQPCGPGADSASDASPYGTRTGTSTSGPGVTPIGPTGVLPGSMPGSMPGTSGTGTSPGVTSPTPTSASPGTTPNP